jgi:glycosyltransferase involved in cell wall biosynthesis
VRRAHATLVVNEREAATLAGMAPSERVLVVGNGVDVATFRPAASPSGEQRVIFCGVLDYRPNEDAVLWLIRDIWPPVRSAIPSARLTIVGANPTRAIARLAARDHSVDLEGAVPDVRPHLWKAAVSVAPLRTARGVQNKVLEAVAAGLPAVVTSAVAEGLPGAIRPACRVGSTASELSSELIDLLGRSAQARRALADSATLEGLTWDARLQPIGAILRDAADAAHHIANPPSIATETAMPARMAARRTARAR